MVAIRPRTRKRRRHERAAAAARVRLDHVRDEIRELGRVGQPVLARERDAVVTALMENRRALGHTAARGSVPVLAPMEIDHWVLWHPSADEVLTELRVGTLREGVDGESLGAPCVVPFRPGRSIVIVSRTDRQREQARDLWQSLVTRVAAITAGRSELVLLDPAGGSFTAGERLFEQGCARRRCPGRARPLGSGGCRSRVTRDRRSRRADRLQPTRRRAAPGDGANRECGLDAASCTSTRTSIDRRSASPTSAPMVPAG